MKNWDTKKLFSHTPYKVIDASQPVQSILYPNEPFRGHPTEVFAYMGIPKESNSSLPAMVCVHGGGGTAFAEWVEMWVNRGYAAIAMDLSGCDGNRNKLPNGGPEGTHEAKFGTDLPWEDLWTYHAISAVLSAHSILRSLPSVDPERVGITGISWGGYLTCIAASLDPRFACAIPVYGCGFLQEESAEVWMEIFAGMTPDQRKRWHDLCDPSVYLPEAKLPMLFVSGTNDFAYPPHTLEKTASLAKGPVQRCVRLEMPHGHEAGWEPNEIKWFADEHLRQGPPLPHLSPPEIRNHHIVSKFRSALPLSCAHFLFTKDHGKWVERKWHKTTAEIHNDTIQITPPKDFTAGFLAIEDDRSAYISSPLLQSDDSSQRNAAGIVVG